MLISYVLLKHNLIKRILVKVKRRSVYMFIAREKEIGVLQDTYNKPGFQILSALDGGIYSDLLL